MLSNCKKFFVKKMYHEETAMILNYVTLKISDPEVAKELENHKIMQQNRIYWIV